MNSGVAFSGTGELPGRRWAILPPIKLSARRLSIIGSGYIGSPGGAYAILQDGPRVFAVHSRDPSKRKTVFSLEGAKALATTTGYQRVYLLWRDKDAKLYLTRY